MYFRSRKKRNSIVGNDDNNGLMKKANDNVSNARNEVDAELAHKVFASKVARCSICFFVEAPKASLLKHLKEQG